MYGIGQYQDSMLAVYL